MHPAIRLAAVFALLGVVFGLGVHYDAAEADHSPYPLTDEINADYDAHVGTEAFVFGQVLAVDDASERATIEVDSDRGTFELAVDGISADVQDGGVVQVHGTLRPGRTIDARNVVVVNSAGSSNLYKYAISTVGAVLVLVAFFREWRFETDSLTFEVRDDG